MLSQLCILCASSVFCQKDLLAVTVGDVPALLTEGCVIISRSLLEVSLEKQHDEASISCLLRMNGDRSKYFFITQNMIY